MAAVLDVIQRCLEPAPSSRISVPQLVEALTRLRRTVPTPTTGTQRSEGRGQVTIDATAAGSVPLEASTPSPSPIPVVTTTYDALAILDAMSSAEISAEVVTAAADTIGHLGVSTLDPLKVCGVPTLKLLAVRRLLTPRRFVDMVIPRVGFTFVMLRLEDTLQCV